MIRKLWKLVKDVFVIYAFVLAVNGWIRLLNDLAQYLRSRFNK